MNQKWINEMVKTILENPGMKVIPLVDSEVVPENDYRSYAGEIGWTSLEEVWAGEEMLYFKDDDDMENAIIEVKGWDWYDAATEADVNKVYESLPWEKVIAVHISPFCGMEENK